MYLNRRKFILSTGVLSAGAMVLPVLGCKNQSQPTDNTHRTAPALPADAAPSLAAFGIQLYTLRDVMPDDPKAVLKQLAEMGYKEIESYEHQKLGIFWGMSHTDFKKYCDDLGLNVVATHFDPRTDLEKKAAQAAEIGMKYLIVPYVGPQKKLDDWKRIADEFNRMGALCQKAGIRFAYHNHAYTFEPLEGTVPQNYLMDNTDPASVDYEMDIYWVVTGKTDPIALLQKYPNRWRLCHIKDRLKTASESEHNASCDLGTGMIDFPKILKVAAENGMQHYIVEQERYDNSTPLKSAAANAEYLKRLVFS